MPYTGFSQATTDLIAGRISLWLPTLGGSIGNIQGGKMRALAISGPSRAEALPNIPTFKELGIEFDKSSWYALHAPKGTPKDIIAKVNREVERVLALPDVRRKASRSVIGSSAARRKNLGEFLKSEIAKWAEVARSSPLK